MRNRMLRIFALCLLAALLAGALPAFAAEKVAVQEQLMWVGSPKQAVILLNWPEGAKVTSITSAKPATLKVGKKAGYGPYGLWMQPLKAGKCKVTVKYKLNGKTKSAVQTMTIKKYPSPISWLKVNGKKVNLTKNKFLVENKKYTKKQFTVAFKLNSGWKVEACNGAYWIGDEGHSMSWKNNKKVSLSAKATSACAALDLRNKKTGDFFNYEIWFIR